MNSQSARQPVAVIGGGPAGMQLALRLAEAHEVLLFDEFSSGGQLLSLGMLGSLEGRPPMAGPDLATEMLESLLATGVNTRFEQVQSITRTEIDGWQVHADGGAYDASAVVLATGGAHGTGPLDGAAALIGRGVSFCPGCDGPMYAGAAVAVIGDGPWAENDAHGLTAFARHVHVVGRSLSADHGIGGSRLTVHTHSHPLALVQRDERVAGLQIADQDGREHVLEVQAVFVSAAGVPRAELIVSRAELDGDGRARVDDDLRTTASGLYAIGDVRAGTTGGVSGALADAERVARALKNDLLNGHHHTANEIARAGSGEIRGKEAP
jgi:thioredoxin reductase (NADPH)